MSHVRCMPWVVTISTFANTLVVTQNVSFLHMLPRAETWCHRSYHKHGFKTCSNFPQLPFLGLSHWQHEHPPPSVRWGQCSIACWLLRSTDPKDGVVERLHLQGIHLGGTTCLFGMHVYSHGKKPSNLPSFLSTPTTMSKMPSSWQTR